MTLDGVKDLLTSRSGGDGDNGRDRDGGSCVGGNIVIGVEE